jgi:hypothetical protein
LNKILIFLFILLLPFTTIAGELETREEIENKSRSLFINENYELLNKIGNSYLKNKSRTSSGLWKLTLYYAGLSSIPNSDVNEPRYWSDLKAKAIKWSKIDNESSFPHMMYADILINEAWMYRGTGWAYTVRKEDWKPFREKIEEARLYLLKYSHLKNHDPRWYEQMLIIAKAQGWDTKKFYELLDEALSVHPQFYEIYFKAINYLQPRWHGSVIEIEEFATYATKKSEAYEGKGMYARIYWYVSQAEYGRDLFTKSNVRWNQMKSGINDVLKKYPDQWNINNFALFSCLAHDKEMTRKLIGMIKGRPIISVWENGNYFDYCKEWANKKEKDSPDEHKTSAGFVAAIGFAPEHFVNAAARIERSWETVDNNSTISLRSK